MRKTTHHKTRSAYARTRRDEQRFVALSAPALPCSGRRGRSSRTAGSCGSARPLHRPAGPSRRPVRSPAPCVFTFRLVRESVFFCHTKTRQKSTRTIRFAALLLATTPPPQTHAFVTRFPSSSLPLSLSFSLFVTAENRLIGDSIDKRLSV